MKNPFGACLVLLGLLTVEGTAAQIVPIAVSPGSERGVAVVGQACPTFSWTAVDWASGYRVEVFEAIGVQIPSYEQMAAGVPPALSKEIGGRALSWTPSAEEQLIAGSLYAWYVQAMDASGQGTWSNGKLFIVQAGVLAGGVEGQLRKTLEEKGIREDVITDVLKEMKGEGAGVLSAKTESKPQSRLGSLGSEGNNTLYGGYAGASITSGLYDTFIGRFAGYVNTSASYNTFLGYYAGGSNTTGGANTFLGSYTGYSNTTGPYNTCLGSGAGMSITTGNTNTFLGTNAGSFNSTGSSNTFLGMEAGYNNESGSNVFIGFQSGYNEAGSGKLYISNSSTNSPLIYGDFTSKILGVNGWLGVGTQTPAYPMEVKTTGRNSVLVVQRSDGGALNFMNASLSYGQFGTGNGYPVRILVNSAWRMSLNLDNSLTMVNGASCTAGGVWTNASSRELKENVEDLSAAEAEEALRELAPVKYNYKVDQAERHVGFIAEDVPELVASKDRKTMSPMNVVGVLTKVVQELEKTVQEQQKALSEYRKSLADQQKTIADLKAQMNEMKKRGR